MNHEADKKQYSQAMQIARCWERITDAMNEQLARALSRAPRGRLEEEARSDECEEGEGGQIP